MNREKPYFLKRSIAYIIDLMIVLLLSGMLSTIFFKNDDYQSESYQKLLQLYDKYSQGEITKDEYNDEYETIYYYSTKDSAGISIAIIGVSLIYYVGLCYYCEGVTLGKRIMKLKIVGNNDRKLHLGHYFVRGLLINLILVNPLNIIMVLLLNKETFVAIHSKIGNIYVIFILITLGVMMYRDDGRGLHDLIAGTKVISTKKDKNKEEVKEEVVEAKVIEEKKTKKKSTKKGSGK